MGESIAIEVAYAEPDSLYLKALRLARGATVRDALANCDLAACYPALDLARATIGIHGRKVQRDQVLRDGDRVEVYRPLHMDPMQARRARARRRSG